MIVGSAISPPPPAIASTKPAANAAAKNIKYAVTPKSKSIFRPFKKQNHTTKNLKIYKIWLFVLLRLKFNKAASKFCQAGLNLAIWVAAYSVKFAGAVGDFILKFWNKFRKFIYQNLSQI